MSGTVVGELAVGVVGGAVVLVGATLAGTVWATGKLIQGTATIVGDTVRGRRVRLAGQQAGQRAGQTSDSAAQRASQRQADYDRQLSQLGLQQQRTLRDFQEASRRQQKQHEESLRRVRQTQQEYTDRRCQELENDLHAAESRFDDRLTTLARSVDVRFTTERDRVDVELRRHACEFRQALENQRRTLQSQIDTLTQQVEDEREAAEDWFQAAQAEAVFVRDQFRHDFFCPGELDVILRRLTMARQNLEQGLYASALPVSQECVLQAYLLRDKLEMLERDWEALRAAAMESLDVGLEALAAYRNFRISAIQAEGPLASASGVAGDAAGYEVDADFWTGGKWSALHEELTSMRQRIASPEANVSTEDLQQFQQAGRDALATAVSLAATAKYALMASVLRNDMQRDFCDRLNPWLACCWLHWQ